VKPLIRKVYPGFENPDMWSKSVNLFIENGAKAQIYKFKNVSHQTFDYGMDRDYLNLS
jgi:hypothetical protein